MERDTETGLDHTLYRQYSPPFGRWYSPDRMVGNVLNPQTWNRYAYVTNNPATFTDPLGLSNGNPYSPSAPPCGGVGQISCQQYFQVTGPAPASDCGAEYSQCYATVGGAVIGINGLNATAFIPAHQVTANGNACTASADAAVQKELQTFAGYAGAKLAGRVAIGAGFGAAGSLSRSLETGDPWAVLMAALIGGAVGAGQNAYADAQTIQAIMDSYMDKLAACMNQPPGPPQ